MATDETARPVKVEHLARLFNLTPRRVQQLANEKVVVKRGRGTYDLLGSIRGYITYLQEQLEGKPTTDLGRELHAQRLRALKFETDVKEGRYLAREDVDAIVAACMATVARIAEQLASRLPARCRGDKTTAELRLIVQSEVRAIREAAAIELRDLADPAAGGQHPDAAADANGGSVGGRKRNPAARKRRARAVPDGADAVHGGAGEGAH